MRREHDERPAGRNAQQPEDPRVRFAAERTLLAWMRTGLALMGFGFVVARFGLFLREIAAAGQVADHQHSTVWSLWIGTALIGLGVAVSLLASFEYYRFVSWSRQGRSYMPRTAMLAVVVAVILALLGIAMLPVIVSWRVAESLPHGHTPGRGALCRRDSPEDSLVPSEIRTVDNKNPFTDNTINYVWDMTSRNVSENHEQSQIRERLSGSAR